jgi:hypothetical protein
VPQQAWDLPDPSGKPKDFLRQLRDRIEKRVEEFIGETQV